MTDLNIDELTTVADHARAQSGRLRMGSGTYGPLDLANDSRDMLVELEAEIVDASSYIRWAIKQRDAERRKHAAEIAALEAENDRLRDRIAHLEAWSTMVASGGC